ncbi:hypothetical protein RJ639_045795 [Escallonia herrerae]|uniref:Uncharacterized protein n=1 Tax=Escallonia herrerae TaxID=1293975 RepID=A0AA89B056_9ASTE|nr:hypothetical protein RJ639_045795 [Escallonia herrerae]
MSQARNIFVATGLVAFAALGLAFPFYMAGLQLDLRYSSWVSIEVLQLKLQFIVCKSRLQHNGLLIACSSRSSREPVIDSSKPLPPQATFRGPYINTGSRDVGPDYQIHPKK